jgi:hypothetical protein
MFFARLPLEIRKMVYEYVMGEETVHLTIGAKKRFGHFVCEGEGDVEEKECGCRVLVGGKEGERLDGACMSLVRVCRRMYVLDVMQRGAWIANEMVNRYSEAIPHLYRAHTFSLLHVTHLLYLPARMPQQRLNSIRTLRLRWAIRALPYLRRGPSQSLAYREDTLSWERGWSIIASMSGLRDLYVVLLDPSPQDMWERNWVELEEQLLRPVRDVTRPDCFELMLPFASCNTEWDMGGSRVVLRKPEGNLVEEDDS